MRKVILFFYFPLFIFGELSAWGFTKKRDYVKLWESRVLDDKGVVSFRLGTRGKRRAGHGLNIFRCYFFFPVFVFFCFLGK